MAASRGLKHLTWRGSVEVTCSVIIIAFVIFQVMLDRQSKTEETLDNRSEHSNNVQQFSREKPTTPKTISQTDDVTHIAVVVCSNRLEQGITVIKSAVVLSRRKIHVHAFPDEKRKGDLTKFLEELQYKYPNKLKYRIYDARFPPIVNHDVWNRIYGPCATLRLFFPEMLPHLDRLLYVDSDIVFIGPPEDLWDQFNNFGSQQIMGVSYDHLVKEKEFIARTKNIPQYTPGRLQSGVLLMDLGRMREFGWTSHVLHFNDFWRYKDNFTSRLFDQSAINLAFFFNPEKAYIISCDWNFRPYHWKLDGRECLSAEEKGPSLIHGYQFAFNGDVPSPFTAVYWAFRDHHPGDRLRTILERMEVNMKRAIPLDSFNRTSTKFDFFTKVFKKYI